MNKNNQKVALNLKNGKVTAPVETNLALKFELELSGTEGVFGGSEPPGFGDLDKNMNAMALMNVVYKDAGASDSDSSDDDAGFFFEEDAAPAPTPVSFPMATPTLTETEPRFLPYDHAERLAREIGGLTEAKYDLMEQDHMELINFKKNGSVSVSNNYSFLANNAFKPKKNYSAMQMTMAEPIQIVVGDADSETLPQEFLEQYANTMPLVFQPPPLKGQGKVICIPKKH